MGAYEFTTDWFDRMAKETWDQLIPQIKPRKILEVGSYEGASACYLIDKLAHDTELEIHCVDTWAGSVELQARGVDMAAVESRFDGNIERALANKRQVDFNKHREPSDIALSRLIAEGKRNYFDFVYIDGSHQAPDVLCDAVLGFRLLKPGCCMVFDDYLWAEKLAYGRDPLRCPKPAIDAFVNLNFRKLAVLPGPLCQLFVQKMSD